MSTNDNVEGLLAKPARKRVSPIWIPILFAVATLGVLCWGIIGDLFA